jgi:DNA-binding XRE family transcriptional regulator
MKKFKIEVTVPESKLGVLLETLFVYDLVWRRRGAIEYGIEIAGPAVDEICAPTWEEREEEAFTPGSANTKPLTGEALEAVLAGAIEFPHDARFDGPGVRVMMKRASLTGTEIASLLGVDQSTVSGWICGRAKPKVAHARELAELLGVPIEQIVRIYRTASV